MEASIFSPVPVYPSRLLTQRCSKSGVIYRSGNRRFKKISAVNDLSTVAPDPAQVGATWQIFVGALAGVTPFVVAGIEFSKRIVAQKKCGVCGGSGLVLRDKYYFRCPSCGGFLPWQSWKRFFSG